MTNKAKTVLLRHSKGNSIGTNTLYLLGGKLRVFMDLVIELGDNHMYTDTTIFWRRNG